MQTIEDQFSPFLGKVIRIDTKKHKLPLFGRLIAISDQFLTIERRDGKPTLLWKKAIVEVQATRNQPDEAT